MDTGPAPSIASLALSAASFWLLRVVSTLHWRVIFAEGATASAVAVSLLDQLGVGYRLLAFAALAFNVWALAKGRPRWLAWLALPPTLIAVSGSMMIQ